MQMETIRAQENNQFLQETLIFFPPKLMFDYSYFDVLQSLAAQDYPPLLRTS